MITEPKLAYAVWSWGLQEKNQLETALADVREAGFSYFESVYKTIHLYEKNAEEFLELADREKVYPVSFYYNLKGDDHAGDVKMVEETLDFLKKTSVRRISIQAPKKQGGGADKTELDNLLAVLSDIADVCSDADIIPCLHPHKNTQVMYENEIDYVMQNLDKIAFGPDTAHLVVGGCDPVEIFSRYAERIEFVHIKDVKKSGPVSVDTSRGESFEVYTDFLELGEGDVDFEKVFDVLDEAGYEGFLTVELDKSRTSQRESAFMNMEYLKKHFFPRYG